eukprot:3935329-Rhodomonas_salina.1
MPSLGTGIAYDGAEMCHGAEIAYGGTDLRHARTGLAPESSYLGFSGTEVAGSDPGTELARYNGGRAPASA